jgi:hypothetical protein
MAKKKNRTLKAKTEIHRVQKTTGATRKTAGRKMRPARKAQAKVKAQAVETPPKPQPQPKSAGANRAEGIRLFKLAGRPTQEQFVLVYGERGPRMTWEQRAAAGVPAEKFQDALAAKQSARLSVPAPTGKN